MSEGASEPVFDLSGGALCLDLVNTVPDWPRASRDKLPDYRALLAWSRQSGTIAPHVAPRLERSAVRRPRQARQVFERALELRALLYRIFAPLAAGKNPAPKDISAFNKELADALARARITPSEDGFAWSWSGPDDALDRLLWPVLRSAADLLTSDDRERIGQCDLETCSWFFIDRSRGRRRRWCDMKGCGNRNKARRHYARQKSARS